MAEEDLWIPRMEEEEESEPDRDHVIGFAREFRAEDRGETRENSGLLERVMNERETILRDEKLSTKEKIKLLESNHQTLLLLRGGRRKTFKTEVVVFGILGFSTILLLTLAVLNVTEHLPTEITLTFLGTTLGGTIATIAQKLGRI